MKSFAEKPTHKSSLLFVVISLLTFSTFAQPAIDEKREIATKEYRDAYDLLDQGTSQAFTTAFAKYKIAERLYKEIGDKFGQAKSLVGMGFTSDSLGNRAEAIEIYTRALPLFRSLKNKYWEARTLNNIGRSYDDLGEVQKALEYFQKALPLRRAARDYNGEAVTTNAIGFAYSELGEQEKALDYYNKALLIRSSADIPKDRANLFGKGTILNNIGRIYDELGDHKKAIKNFNDSLVFRKTIGDRNGEATTLSNIGIVYSGIGEREKALEYHNRALKIFEEIGNETRKASTLNNIGVTYAESGNNQKALEIYLRVLAIHKKFVNRSSEAVTLNNIGFSYFALNQNAKGFENLNEALLIQKAIGDRRYEAITLSNLMLGWQKAGNKNLAVFYGKQSVNKYQELRQAIRTLDIETRRTYLRKIENVYRQLADLLIETGQFAQAEQVLRMLKEEEYFDFVRRDSKEISTLSQRISLTKKEKDLIKRYLKLSGRVSEIGRELTELDKRKVELSEKESMYYAKLKQDLNNANAAFKLFLEKELVKEFGVVKKKGIEFDRALQAKLKKWGEGTVTLYTVVSENRYRVILTTPNTQVDGKTEISSVDLNKKIFAYRDALQKIEIDPRPLGKELYDILIKPIEKHLEAANAKTLVWSLDGTLRYIPISTLSPDGKTYLVERYRNVVTTPKTRNDLTDSDSEWRALGVGVSEKQKIINPENPLENIDFSPIPGTKKELTTIIKDELKPNETGILNGRRFLNDEFTLASLSNSLTSKTSDGKRKYTAVHIASHFQLGSNWANSFLLLGNGKILTLKELKNSPSLDFGDVELVTLSACDTAFTADSNGKEVDSLAEVIQAKSGKAVLAALWAVVDESTPLLMSEFYRLRKENPKMTKAEAMQKVQRAFVTGKLKPSKDYIEKLNEYYGSNQGNENAFKFNKNAPFAHPYFWSPFVLIGNWR